MRIMPKPFEVQRDLFVVAGDLEHPALCELDGVEALLDWGRPEALMSGIYASETARIRAWMRTVSSTAGR